MNTENKEEMNMVRTDEDFDREAFQRFMLSNVEWWSAEDVKVKQFSAGFSNLTYLISCGKEEFVMRRPPIGPLPPRAHDMKREYYLLKALSSHFPYVPKTIKLCEDESVIGAPFYVMERKVGIIFDGEFPKGFEVTKEKNRQISFATVDTLAELHQINYKVIGLKNFGRPDGFAERQVNNWINRYSRSQTHDIPVINDLYRWFINHIPISKEATIIHNDYKLNNLMFSSANIGKVEGVFDWELATIADPLFDLATALGYWTEESDWETIKQSLPSITVNSGFITREEFIHRYSLKTGQEVPDLTFYMAFTYFKIAVVMQQIYYRWFNGQTKDSRFATLNLSVKSLLEYAYHIIVTGKY